MELYYFLPAILFLGVITSYEDIRTGKIRNKWILGCIAFALFMYLALFLNKQVSSNDIVLALANLLITIAFSFILWNFGFWSAGDAKLFICFSALIPVTIYNYNLIEFFPSFTLLVNTIVPFFLYLLIKTFFSVSFKVIKKSFFKAAKDFPIIFVSMLALGWIADIINKSIFNSNNYILIFILYAFVYFAASSLLSNGLSLLKIKKLKEIHIYLILIAIRAIFDFGNFLSLEYLVAVLVSSLGYSLFLKGAYNLASLKATKKISIWSLKEGDILEKEEKKLGFLGRFLNYEPEGLTEKELKAIKKFRNAKKLNLKVSVAETIPFAPIMFLGVLITLASKGIFIYLLAYLFRLVGG